MLRGRVFSWARRTPYLAGLPRDVAVLAFVAFAVALGYGIVAPAIPVYARTFGVSAFLASAVISGFALMRLISAGPAGLAVERWGERRVMSVGIWMVALSSLAAAAARSFPQLLVLRGVGGIGSAMFTVSAMALLLRSVSSAQRGRASGAWQAGFLFGGVAGPAVGGIVTGWSIRAPFVVYAATLAVAGLIAARFLTGSPAREDDAPALGGLAGVDPAPSAGVSSHAPSDDPMDDPTRLVPTTAPTAHASTAPTMAPTTIRHALGLPAYRAALVVNLATGFIVFGLRISIVPLFVTEWLALAVSWVGAGFVVAAAVQAVALIPAGRRADRSGRRGALLVGTSALGISMLLLALPFGSGSGAVVLLLAMAASGLASAFLGASSAAVVGDVTGGRSGGRVVSGYQMIGDLGGILGPLAAGALADALGFHYAFAAGVAVAGLALVAVLAMPETLRLAVARSPR